MHILVTGGCGYVGTPLTGLLLARGYKVTVVDIMWFGNYLSEHDNLNVIRADIRNYDSIPLDDVDVIIHLAGIANDPSVELDPGLSWDINALATMQLAEKAVRKGVSHFIYASSGSIYGVKEEQEVTEDLQPTPISIYNKTKMVTERVLLSYKDQMTVQCVRPGTVCGCSPRMRLDVLVNMLVMQALTKGVITLFGGSQQRPHLHIEDMVDVYLYLIDKGSDLEGIYNVGYINESVKETALKIANHIPCELIFKDSDDIRSYRMNSDKIITAGFSYKKNIDDAICQIIEMYNRGDIQDENKCYNVKWMRTIL